MPPSLVAFRGLPGSGKTREALRILSHFDLGDAARVNRDGLRAMMLPADYWQRDLTEEQREPAERAVTVAQHAAIFDLLTRGDGATVLVDDINLDPLDVDALRRLAARASADFELIDLTGVDLELCVARDNTRPPATRVGERTIRAMHAEYLQSTQENAQPAIPPSAETGDHHDHRNRTDSDVPR
jgi:predicted kinase